jgi:hypothetical protein
MQIRDINIPDWLIGLLGWAAICAFVWAITDLSPTRSYTPLQSAQSCVEFVERVLKEKKFKDMTRAEEADFESCGRALEPPKGR